MHYSNFATARCRETKFNINKKEIICIRDGCLAVFLDTSISAFLPRDTVTIENLKQRALKIMNSKLGPWQRIVCLKTFFYPSLLFMRTDQLTKTDCHSIDDAIKPLIKRTLGLPPPPMKSMSICKGENDDGQFGIPLAAEDSDIAIIDGGTSC